MRRELAIESESISVADARAIVNLLGGVARAGGHRLERARRIMEGISRLIDADVWIWWSGRHRPPHVTTFDTIDGGYTDEVHRTAFRQWVTVPDCHILFNRVAFCALEEHTTFTYEDVKIHPLWIETPLYQKMREASGMEAFLISAFPMSPATCSITAFHRLAGRQAFSSRDKCLLHTLTSELMVLHESAVETPTEAVVNELSPRLRQVLMLVLAGHSRKQIARDLTISEHTVGGYLKDLHTRLNVNSRAELMAYFMQGMEGEAKLDKFRNRDPV